MKELGDTLMERGAHLMLHHEKSAGRVEEEVSWPMGKAKRALHGSRTNESWGKNLRRRKQLQGQQPAQDETFYNLQRASFECDLGFKRSG
jgi:hypothetical protein